MKKATAQLLAITTCVLGISAPAVADVDRPPTAEERAAIEKVLREEGFVSWEQDIELDDGHWEVDNARTKAGEKYDLELDPQGLQIVRRERDD